MLGKIKIFLKRLVKRLVRPQRIDYINGSDRLPPPLGAKEEAKAFELLKNGDKKGKELLIVHNLRLVVYIAKKFESTGIGLEDLVSIGTIGLIKGVNTFQPEKKIKLATYASRCIENEILMYLRKFSHHRGDISIDEPLNIDWDGNELLLSDVLGTENDIVTRDIENEVERELILREIENLRGREKTIMKMRFGIDTGREMTQKQVADVVGISQSYISRLEKKILGKIKKNLEKIC